MLMNSKHDCTDTLKDYWLTLEESSTPFYSNTMKCDFFPSHIDIYTF